MTRIRYALAVLALSTALVGFRVYPGRIKWAITSQDSTIWVTFCSRPSFSTNDLPSSDPMTGQSLTFTNLTQSIFNDFANNVPTSYFRLADSTTDSSYSATKAATRTIYVCYSGETGAAGGHAVRTITNGYVTACTINIGTSTMTSAKSFVRTLTHELGHCAGLDHPQETRAAIMSYFAADDLTRLQTDDKSGLTYLYATDDSYASEAATLGMSCAPR